MGSGKLLLAACLLLLAVVCAPASASPVPEGVILPFQAPVEFSWRLSPGNYFIVVHHGHGGGTYDLSGLQDRPETSHTPAGPGTGFGTLVTFSEGQTRTLRVVNGSGFTVMTRHDLVATTLPPHVGTGKLLLPAQCHAFLYSPNFTGFALVDGRSENVSFAMVRDDFVPMSEGKGRFRASFDADQIPGVLVQACNPTTETQYYTINIERDASRAPHLVPSVAWPLAAIAIGLLAWCRRKPR